MYVEGSFLFIIRSKLSYTYSYTRKPSFHIAYYMYIGTSVIRIQKMAEYSAGLQIMI